MANDRIRREGVDDYSGADPGRQSDMNEDVTRGSEEIRGISDESEDEFEDTEDLEDEEEESDE